MTAWRLAKSLEKFRSQVNARWPNRSRASDGTVGDTSHAARASDHNPGSDHVVEAIDITHDPRSGCDAAALAEALKASRDPRIKYIISNARICSGNAGPKPWAWRGYSGVNPHNKHMHLSVTPSGKDVAGPWAAVEAVPTPRPRPDVPPPPDIELPRDYEPDPEPGFDPYVPRTKPSLIRRVRNWLAGMLAAGGIGYGGFLTDAQTVAILCVTGVLLLLGAIGFAFWLFGVDKVRSWIARQVG